jgi:CMP-N-acetylneuraminic acid synthetase
MRTLTVIVARGKSKRVPRKNLRPILGHPIIGWAVRAAKASRTDRVIVSTEDEEIRSVSRQYGGDVPFLRPDHLADDFAEEVDIIQHALQHLYDEGDAPYDKVLLQQPTTPFVHPDDFNALLDKVQSAGAASGFLARTVREPPRWMWTTDKDGMAVPFLDGVIRPTEQHTQKLPELLFPSGAGWVVSVDALNEQRSVYASPVVIQTMSEGRSIDIDEELDFIMAESIARQFNIRIQE